MISRFFRIEFIVFFVNVIGFAVLTLNLFVIGSGASLEIWQLVRELLVLHVILMICAYVALTLSVIFSGMYMFLHGRLKGKQWSKSMQRLPSLDVINRFMLGIDARWDPVVNAFSSCCRDIDINRGPLRSLVGFEGHYFVCCLGAVYWHYFAILLV